MTYINDLQDGFEQPEGEGEGEGELPEDTGIYDPDAVEYENYEYEEDEQEEY